MNLKAWEQELAAVMPFVLEARRDLHRHPEVGGEEQWTRAYLEKALQDMGIPTQRFEGTCGVMAQVEGMRPGPCLGIRADIDGLPVEEETGLTISVGVSFNKTLAKLGSDYKKPNATTVLSRDTYRTLLYPLPVDRLLFVGKSAAQRLCQTGIRTIGDLAGAQRETLVRCWAKAGANCGTWQTASTTRPCGVSVKRGRLNRSETA